MNPDLQTIMAVECIVEWLKYVDGINRCQKLLKVVVKLKEKLNKMELQGQVVIEDLLDVRPGDRREDHVLLIEDIVETIEEIGIDIVMTVEIEIDDVMIVIDVTEVVIATEMTGKFLSSINSNINEKISADTETEDNSLIGLKNDLFYNTYLCFCIIFDLTDKRFVSQVLFQ